MTDPDRSAPTDTWDDAPCGLLRVDETGAVAKVNARFLTSTGLRREEVLGVKPWTRLLSAGSRIFFDAQLAPVLDLDGSFHEVMLDLRRADGGKSPALFSAAAIRDDQGRSVGARIAVMTVPDRRRYEDELRDAQRQAENATAASAVDRRRLERLARANAALASSIDVEFALRQLAGVLIDQLADWCLILVAGDAHTGQQPRAAAAHVDPRLQPELDRLAALLPEHITSDSALSSVLDGNAGVLVAEVTTRHMLQATDSAEARELLTTLGLASAIVVPSIARGARVATVIVARRPGRVAFTSDDLADVADLGARTGLAIDNLNRYALEHRNSVALQQVLLTTLTEIPEAEIVARYLPAALGNEVGGDWYDCFRLADRTPVIVIGDVMGHDIHAAAAMGQLRSLIRGLAYTLDGTPADTLSAVDAAAHALQSRVLTTAVIAHLRPGASPAETVLTWSNAGHPPPILITVAGSIQVLDAKPNRLLGFAPTNPRTDQSTIITAGDTLFFYTDGLIERAGEDAAAGFTRLLASLHDAHQRSLEQLCDLVLSDPRHRRRDDTAILALRLRPAGPRDSKVAGRPNG